MFIYNLYINTPTKKTKKKKKKKNLSQITLPMVDRKSRMSQYLW